MNLQVKEIQKVKDLGPKCSFNLNKFLLCIKGQCHTKRPSYFSLRTCIKCNVPSKTMNKFRLVTSTLLARFVWSKYSNGSQFTPK